MEKLLLMFAFIVTMDRGQAASFMAFYFGVHSVNPVPGVFPMKGASNCKNSERSLLTGTVVGCYGEERVVVQRLEYNGIDIDQTPLQTAPTIPDVGEEHDDSSRKVDGGAVERGGGGGPGSGGDDPREEGPDGNSNTDGNTDDDGNERNVGVGEILSRFQRMTLKKLAKISISIAAQTGIALVAISRDKPTFIVYLVVAITVCAYFFFFFSKISEKQSAAAITAAIITSPEPDAGEVLPRSPTNLSVFNDEMPLIPISESAVVAPLDAEAIYLPVPPDQIAPTYNNGGSDSTEFTNRSDPITLAKHSLVITAQTAAAIIISSAPGFTSAAKILPNLVAVLTFFAYVFCISAVWLSRSNPLIAGLMGEMSTACAGVSFVVMMGLLLPHKLFWIVVLNCMLLFSVFVTSSINLWPTG